MVSKWCIREWVNVFLIRLTLYYRIPTFNDVIEEGFGKHCGKRKKCWFPAFSPFPVVFSTLSNRKLISLAMFNLSSANTVNFVTAKILAFGKKLYTVLDLLFLSLLLFLTLIPKEFHLLTIVQISIE